MLFRGDENEEFRFQCDKEQDGKLDLVSRGGLGKPPDIRICAGLLVFDQAKAYRNVLTVLPGHSYVAPAAFLHKLGKHLREFAFELVRRGFSYIEYAPFCRRPDIREVLILDGLIGDTPALNMFEDTAPLETGRLTCSPRNA